MQMLVIALRLLHVTCGAVWVGGVTVLTLFVLPAIDATGQVGEKFMQHVTSRTKLTIFLPVLGLLAVLSGIGLYWHDVMISDATFAASPVGITFGIGGLAGILALLVGALVTSRAAGELGRIGAALGASSGPPTAAQQEQMARLRGRLKSSATIAWLLMLIALAAMSIARYT